MLKGGVLISPSHMSVFMYDFCAPYKVPRIQRIKWATFTLSAFTFTLTLLLHYFKIRVSEASGCMQSALVPRT